MSATRSWGSRHPYVTMGLRVTGATWNLVLGILLLAHGYQWGSMLFAVSALVFWVAYTSARGKSGLRRSGQS